MFFDLYGFKLSRLFASLTKQHNLFYTLKKLIPIQTWDLVKSLTFFLFYSNYLFMHNILFLCIKVL